VISQGRVESQRYVTKLKRCVESRMIVVLSAGTLTIIASLFLERARSGSHLQEYRRDRTWSHFQYVHITCQSLIHSKTQN